MSKVGQNLLPKPELSRDFKDDTHVLAFSILKHAFTFFLVMIFVYLGLNFIDVLIPFDLMVNLFIHN